MRDYFPSLAAWTLTSRFLVVAGQTDGYGWDHLHDYGHNHGHRHCFRCSISRRHDRGRCRHVTVVTIENIAQYDFNAAHYGH